MGLIPHEVTETTHPMRGNYPVNDAPSYRFKGSEQLYAEYGDKVYSQALRLTRNVHDAKDVSQIAWMKIMLNFRRFHSRNGANIGSWIYRIVENTFLDYMRQNRKYQDCASLDSDFIDSKGQPEEEVIQRLSEKKIMQALSQMSPMHGEILRLAREEMSYEQMADSLGIPEGTVRSRLSRARVELKRRLKTEH